MQNLTRHGHSREASRRAVYEDMRGGRRQGFGDLITVDRIEHPPKSARWDICHHR